MPSIVLKKALIFFSCGGVKNTSTGHDCRINSKNYSASKIIKKSTYKNRSVSSSEKTSLKQDLIKQISEKIEKTFENLEGYLSGKTNELQGFGDFNKQKVEDDNNGKKSRLAKLVCILNFLQKLDLNDTLTKEKEEVILKSNDKKEADKLLFIDFWHFEIWIN